MEIASYFFRPRSDVTDQHWTGKINRALNFGWLPSVRRSELRHRGAVSLHKVTLLRTTRRQCMCTRRRPSPAYNRTAVRHGMRLPSTVTLSARGLHRGAMCCPIIFIARLLARSQAVVYQALDPRIYEALGLPYIWRYHYPMLALHMWFVVRRFMGEGPEAKAFMQNVYNLWLR